MSVTTIPGGQLPSPPEPWTKRSPAGGAATERVQTQTVVGESWELVRKAQRGDNDAFGRLYARYYRRIYSYIRKRVGHVHLAEDLTSDTFLRAFRHIGSLHFRGKNVDAWLITIARNVIIDHQRSGSVRNELAMENVYALDWTTEGPEERVLSRVEALELRASFAALTRPQRECLFFRFYGDVSVSATAELMERNVTSIRALQYRAVRRLEEIITGPGQPTSGGEQPAAPQIDANVRQEV